VSYQVNWEIQALDQTAGFLGDDPIGVAALWDAVGQLADEPRPHGMDFLPQWAGSDSEFSGDARKSVNLTGVRARRIDHDGRLNHAS
jgi:hypothetical protein